MPTWTCKHCRDVISYEQGGTAPGSAHRKQCLLSPKKISVSEIYWPVPVLGGVHCCPFLYRKCSYSSTIDRIREHCRSSGCCGPEIDATPGSVYQQAASLSPADLGAYIKTTFLTISQAIVNAPSSDSTGSGGSGLDRANDDERPVLSSSSPPEPPLFRSMSAETSNEMVPDHQSSVWTPKDGSGSADPAAAHLSDTCLAAPEKEIQAFHTAHMPNSEDSQPPSHSDTDLEAPAPLPAADPLYQTVNIRECDELRLMIKFQPDLKLMICGRCQCAIFSDHVVGHLWNNHKKFLPFSLKKQAVEAAVTQARDRLQPIASSDPPPVLPNRHLPPLPWLTEHEPGLRCRHCPYAARTIGSIQTHGFQAHAGKTPSIYKEDRPVLVQRLFARSYYFVVHPVLENNSPDDLFTALYSSLPAKYLNGAIVDAHTINGSGPSDLSPFLANTGWVDAMKGHSMAKLRRASEANAQEGDASWMSRIKGLGKSHFSSIRSVSHVDPRVLEGLTSWRTRYRPFQILQEKESIAAYGLICDRLVMMVLRTFCRGESEGRGESDGESGKESSEESGEQSEEESGREGESNSLRDGECDSEQAGSEGERESDYVSSDDEDLDEWGHGENENETNHQNSTYTGDISHREDQANEAEGYDTPSHSYPVTLHPTVLQCAKRLRDRCRRPLAQSSQKSLQQAYHSLVLATFTTKTDKGHFPLHSLMDGFVMSISIDAHLRFVPAHLISSHLAKVIYSALFSMLVQVLKTPDPYQTFVDTLQRWIKPGMDTPFCSVRRYTRLCYAICRSHIALPRLQFASAHSPEFKFDGKKLSVISMIQMYHAVYSHMVDVLRHRLLFGANDAALQPLKKPGDLVDLPHIQSVGQGVLVSEMHACWAPMKIIVDNTRLRQKYFIQASNGKLLPRIEAWEEYVEDIEVFKEHFYFLFHQLSGMPKRGTEEIRAKIVDTSFRGRNLMYLFERLACVGDYNKSSRNTGNDKLTLHFLPRPLEYVLRRFQASVAAIGAWAVDVVLDSVKDPHYSCYLFSSKGQRWTSPRLSSILQRLSAQYLPGGISLGMSCLRHILPGIAEHYHLSNFLEHATNGVLHSQLGHTADTGNRMYARGHQDHPQLTNPVVHQTIAFCDLWHELLGFKDDPPNLQSALLLQEGFTRNGSSSTKTLASVWVHRTPLASMPPVILLPASRNASPPPIDGDIRGSGSDSDADEGPSKRPIILLPRNASPINGYIRGSHSDSDMAERPSKRPRIESAAETPAGSLDPNTSHGASAHLQPQVDQVECEKVLCPRCNVLIDSINKSLKVHFRDQKQQEADSGHPQWHTLSSTIALPWTSNKQVRIYRHMDLKYMCPCGKYSHHDEGGILEHLKAIDTSNQQMMKEHSKDAQRPTWSRVLI